MAADVGALSRGERGSGVVETAMGTLEAVLSGRVSSQFLVVKAHSSCDLIEAKGRHGQTKPVVHLFPQVHLFPS